MSIACVDTSCFVAIMLSEPNSSKMARRLKGFEQVFAATLLESELRAVSLRERIDVDDRVLASLQWIMPDRRLTREIERILAVGYLRGADCWHLACALYVFEDASAVTFLTLDDRQRKAAERLGFII